MVIGIILILVALAAATFLIKWFTKKPYWFVDPISRGMEVLKTTPIRVEDVDFHYETGAAKIPHEAALRGIANAFRRAGCKYTGVDRSTHRIKVVVLKGERSPAGVPSFRVAIAAQNPYFNSEYDQMKGSKRGIHYIFAAGQMLTCGEPHGDSIMIPSDTDEHFIETISDYEMEHPILAKYDGDEFERTKTHIGAGHPIIPDQCPAVAGFASRPSLKLLCLTPNK